MTAKALQQELKHLANKDKAKVLSGFFKTYEGGYGAGDNFLGLTVPVSRKVALKYANLPLEEVKVLLESPIHEERLIALLILVRNFSIGSDKDKKTIYDFYLSQTKHINNWDLVDLSADKIVGEYLLMPSLLSLRGAKRRSNLHGIAASASGETRNDGNGILYKLAHSKNLWERRISIIATYAFIKKGQYKDTFKIAEILLHDSHDLIQKAVGWMLREVGKRVSEAMLVEFLAKHYKTMPRTMLRYAIERFPEIRRKAYLRGEV